MKAARRWTLLAAAVLFLAPGSLWAEDVPKDDRPNVKDEDPVVGKARARRKRADALRVARRHAEAIQDYESAIRILRALGGDHEELARRGPPPCGNEPPSKARVRPGSR